MDVSQISELASAIMDSWASAQSGAELMAGSHQGLVQQQGSPEQQQINKILLSGAIKQEAGLGQQHSHREYSADYPGVIPIPNYGGVTLNAEQVPMDDLDPLESFSFWDGENFYSQTDFCDMQTDNNSFMPTLAEYAAEDELTQDGADQGFSPIKGGGDFLNNPTLAELNACNDPLFEYSVEEDHSAFLTDDSSLVAADNGLSRSFPESHFVTSPTLAGNLPGSGGSFVGGLNFVPSSGYIDIKQPTLSSSCPASSRFVPNSHSQFLLGPCDEKFLLCPQNSPASDSFFAQRMEQDSKGGRIPPLVDGNKSSRMAVPPMPRLQEQQASGGLLSSSAPPDVTMATYFSKIKSEPPSSHSPGPRSVTERSLSGFSSLSLSNDDESGSFFDSDAEDDFSSDEDVYQYESDDALSTSWPSGKEDKSCQHRKHRFFWQYNLQSRGSKTQNILPKKIVSDPHVLNDAFDPVFSEECALPVKHSGKARKGDGNDLTPNPCKLYNIGLELKKLNRLIYNINPHESAGGKPLSRKEKNKLASRVCRLKKKAQHEANKIKLYGLQQEHKKLITILVDTKELLRYKVENMHDTKLSNCSKKLENYLTTNEPHKVAGNTATFVNEVLEKVAKGECDGGLGQI